MKLSRMIAAEGISDTAHVAEQAYPHKLQRSGLQNTCSSKKTGTKSSDINNDTTENRDIKVGINIPQK